MIVIAIVGYVLSLIPLITMYDLTEEDHEAHISVLKIRAALEDYATNNLSSGQLEQAQEIYKNEKAVYNESLSKYETASAKEKRKLKRVIKAQKLIIDEKDRFNQSDMIEKVKKAQELLSHSVEQLYGISEPTRVESLLQLSILLSCKILCLPSPCSLCEHNSANGLL